MGGWIDTSNCKSIDTENVPQFCQRVSHVKAATDGIFGEFHGLGPRDRSKKADLQPSVQLSSSSVSVSSAVAEVEARCTIFFTQYDVQAHLVVSLSKGTPI